jgi:hypothetical protein
MKKFGPMLAFLPSDCQGGVGSGVGPHVAVPPCGRFPRPVGVAMDHCGVSSVAGRRVHIGEPVMDENDRKTAGFTSLTAADAASGASWSSAGPIPAVLAQAGDDRR